jgi:hypothetical protein
VGYNTKDWTRRISERSDLTASITHLTRQGNSENLLEQVIKILADKKLIGSNTKSGFIVGDTPAVCFQDAPLHSIGQNIWFEQKFRESNPSSKVRYAGAGFVFKKNYAYKKGARPVIYEQTEIAKKLLPPKEWWRIVNFNLSNDDSIIDWTHEREWRCPNDFEFAISEVTVLLTNHNFYRKFIQECEARGLDFHHKIRGIVITSELVF